MPEAAKNSNARECDPVLGAWQQIQELIRAFALAVLIPFVAPGNSPAQSPPFNVVQGDGLLHVASGFLFPAQIGEFRRIVTKQYDQAGRDISVGYNADGPEIAATIFVYPVHGKKLEEEFQFRKNEVVSQHPAAKVTAHGPASVSPARISALMAEFLYTDIFRGRPQKLRSRLIVAQRGEWSAEYRITYPASGAKKAAAQADYLVATFAWPSPDKTEQSEGQ
ncbi:MAG: hypothetical protein JO333_02555 [Verrucomicrobia bacterium]|nr:hypothetical protein [Verrucomicrobiota bacterium]